jgi:phosphatidylserine/phosphatidylglycerophosphate/cardiolipin synthase-like enzyme
MGGVHHAKYLVADDEVYVGSANFDWRSLDHIHELGLHLSDRATARFFGQLYDADWEAAAGRLPKWFARTPPDAKPASTAARLPTCELCPEACAPLRIATHLVQPVASPLGFLPGCGRWDLDHLLDAIDGAKTEIKVQLLNFETVGHDGASFELLDAALRRAAIRGVRVRLLLSHWQKSPKKIAAAQALARQAGIDVKIVTIPEADSGFVPFARVIHAKYLVVDDERVWLGTSNWGGDYFLRSRNVGVMVRSAELARQLGAVFDGLATSALGEAIDPDKSYEPPRIAN